MFKRDYIFVGVDASANDHVFYLVNVKEKNARAYAEYLKSNYGFCELVYYPIGKQRSAGWRRGE